MVFCEIKDGAENTKKALDRIYQQGKNESSSLYQKIKNSINSFIKSIRLKRKKAERVVNDIKKQYDEQAKGPIGEFRARRPDITFLIDLLITFILTYLVINYLPGFFRRKLHVSDRDLELVSKVPESAFPLEKKLALDGQIQSKKDFLRWRAEYRDGMSFFNSGADEINKGAAFDRIVTFILQRFLPYFLIGYIVWLIVKYIKRVLAAIWGLFVKMYQFVVKKIKCKLAEQWFVRFLFGWSRCNPQFGSYYNEWKQDVQNGIDKERLRIARGYQQIQTQIPNQISNKVGGSFIGSIGKWFKSLWDWLLGFLASMYKMFVFDPIKYLQFMLAAQVTYPFFSFRSFNDRLRKMTGKPYYSMTKSGKLCKCKPKETPATQNIDKVNKVIDKIKDLAPSVSPKLPEFKFETSCEEVDDAAKTNIPKIIFILCVVILATIAGLFIAQRYFFLPYRLFALLKPVMTVGMDGNTHVSYFKIFIFSAIVFAIGTTSYFISK